MNIDSLDLILSGVHLGKHNVEIVGKELGCLVEVRSQLFAMAAPRCVELDQHLLIRVQHEVVECSCDYDLHWLIVSLGHWRRLKVKSNFSSAHSLHKRLQSLSSDFVSIVAVLIKTACEIDGLRT